MKNLVFLFFLTLFSFNIENLAANASSTINYKVLKVNSSVNLVVQKGDITKCKTEAIVNAANEQLLGGAGVCGAIFNTAGWNKLQDACNKYPEINGARCLVGQACMTDSFNLRTLGINFIIHAVGPDCRIVKDQREQDRLLESSYKSSLILADKNNIKSIAFPFISSAIYSFPKKRASDIALKTIIQYVRNNDTKVESIHLVLFSQEDFDIFCKAINGLTFLL